MRISSSRTDSTNRPKKPPDNDRNPRDQNEDTRRVAKMQEIPIMMHRIEAIVPHAMANIPSVSTECNGWRSLCHKPAEERIYRRNCDLQEEATTKARAAKKKDDRKANLRGNARDCSQSFDVRRQDVTLGRQGLWAVEGKNNRAPTV